MSLAVVTYVTFASGVKQQSDTRVQVFDARCQRRQLRICLPNFATLQKLGEMQSSSMPVLQPFVPPLLEGS